MAKKTTKKAVEKTGIVGWVKNRTKERIRWCRSVHRPHIFTPPHIRTVETIGMGVWTMWKLVYMKIPRIIF